MASTAPIGVFDSGLGGISVAREIRRDMPNEHVLYFGDSANAPYGTKSPEQVRELSDAIVKRFVEQGVKAVVIACNTATSAAANELRDRYDIPIIGMEPALKVACDRGHGNRQRVIVAATPLTLRERKFAVLMDRFKADHTIFPEPCPGLVEIVEHGQLDDHDVVMRTLHQYFDQYDLSTIDAVVLGCTHFVFYRDYFRELLPDTAEIIDGNEGTVRHLGVVLESLGKLAPEDTEGDIKLANSDTSVRIAQLAQSLLLTLRECPDKARKVRGNPKKGRRERTGAYGQQNSDDRRRWRFPRDLRRGRDGPHDGRPRARRSLLRRLRRQRQYGFLYLRPARPQPHVLHTVRIPQGICQFRQLHQKPQLRQSRLCVRHAEQPRRRESGGL